VSRLLAGLLLAATLGNTAWAAKPRPIDFDTQVVPILTRYGCNSGACHGAAVGRGGFRLSLYGSRPEADYESIALELQHRRVNRARPAHSLLVLKPTGQFDHGGDVRFSEDSAAAAKLLRWIREGAKRDGTVSLAAFEIHCSSHTVAAAGESVRMRASAVFTDGTQSDVTAVTTFTADDPSAVSIQPDATVTVLRAGRHIIVARFLDRVVPVELILPWGKPTNPTPTKHVVDLAVDERLSVLGLPASPVCDDATFIRRVFLDLTGRLPQPNTVLDFTSDRDERKREVLIDSLLASDAFTDFWTLRLSRLLRVAQVKRPEAAMAWRRWLRDNLENSVGWDQIVRQLITAEGRVTEDGPAAFYRVGTDPRARTEFLSESLLGIRLRCANCHDHPLDQWTQDDYHGLAAIMAQVSQGETISFNPRGSVIHPGTGLAATPRLPGDKDLAASADLRPSLAEWMVSPSNTRFSVAFVNRVWSSLMGRGLVEPVDDLRLTNPATHPKLLQDLSSQFAANGFQLRPLIRTICTSRAYQRSVTVIDANANDQQFYSHGLYRPLLPEVLLDAICTVTGVPEADEGGRPVASSVASENPLQVSAALTTLGRCDPGTSCSSEESVGGMARVLALINGPLLNRKLSAAEGHVHKFVASDMTTDEIVTSFYLRALSRTPKDSELKIWRDRLNASGDKKERLRLTEDFVWALLTSEDFRTNH
jgi:hypothetical protein